MGNRKNLLITGLALAITLFTSVHISTMNPLRKKQNDELLVAAQKDLKEIKEAEALLVKQNLTKNDREIKQKIKDYRLEIAALEDLIKNLQKNEK